MDSSKPEKTKRWKPDYLKDFDPSAHTHDECYRAFMNRHGPVDTSKEAVCRSIANLIHFCIDQYGSDNFHCIPDFRLWRKNECVPEPGSDLEKIIKLRVEPSDSEFDKACKAIMQEVTPKNLDKESRCRTIANNLDACIDIFGPAKDRCTFIRKMMEKYSCSMKDY